MPKIKVKRLKQESAHRQTDATKRIIAPTTRSNDRLYCAGAALGAVCSWSRPRHHHWLQHSELWPVVLAHTCQTSARWWLLLPRPSQERSVDCTHADTAVQAARQTWEQVDQHRRPCAVRSAAGKSLRLWHLQQLHATVVVQSYCRYGYFNVHLPALLDPSCFFLSLVAEENTSRPIIDGIRAVMFVWRLKSEGYYRAVMFCAV